MTDVLSALGPDDMPVCLHTQPSSYRAIKLYTDFGFKFITDPAVGARVNDLERALPALKQVMPAQAYAALGFARAPKALLDAAAGEQLAALVRAGIGCKLRQRRGANGEAEFTLYVDRADLDVARAAVADLSALSAKYL